MKGVSSPPRNGRFSKIFRQAAARMHSRRRSVRSLKLNLLLAALRVSVDQAKQKPNPRIEAPSEYIPPNLQIKVEDIGDHQSLIRIITCKNCCPLSCYLEVLESAGMEVVHVTCFSKGNRTFYSLMVEGHMKTPGQTLIIQSKLYRMASSQYFKHASEPPPPS